MRKAIELNPKNAQALNYLGYTYAEAGNHLDEAERLVKRALAIEPEDGFYVDSLGWVYYRKGEYGKAAEQLEKAVNLTGDDPTITEHLGDAYAKLGRDRAGRATVRRRAPADHGPGADGAAQGKIASPAQCRQRQSLIRCARIRASEAVRRASLAALRGYAALALAVCQLSACALIRRAPSKHSRRSPATTELLAALADRERVLHSMQSGAIMEYSAADGHHFRTHEEIALARPASMRVEAVAPFGATMVLAATDAGRLMIFDPSKNVLMSGGANAATLERFVRIPLAPPAAVDLLMGLAPDPAQLVTPPDSVSDTEGMTVALWHIGDGGTRELGFMPAGSWRWCASATRRARSVRGSLQ